ncbi:hypothetical protein ACB092_08G204100 [Castanea dentata]
MHIPVQYISNARALFQLMIPFLLFGILLAFCDECKPKGQWFKDWHTHIESNVLSYLNLNVIICLVTDSKA